MTARFPLRSPGRDPALAPRLIGLLLILVCIPAAAVMAQSENKPPEPFALPSASPRAVEDRSLNLMLDYQALIEAEDKQTSPAAAGSYRAAQDVQPRVDWSRPVGNGWDLEPVVLNRRQAGQPVIPDDDQEPQLLGIELRKRF